MTSTPTINFYIICSIKTNIFKYPWLNIHERWGWEMLWVISRGGMGTPRGNILDSPGSCLAPQLLPAAEVLVIQGPCNGELCWEWNYGCNGSSRITPFSPNGLRNWSGSSALAAQVRIFWGCLMGSCCGQEGKGDFPLVTEVGIACASKISGKMQTNTKYWKYRLDFWVSVQHRNGECRREKPSCACSAISLFPFHLLLCSAFISWPC